MLKEIRISDIKVGNRHRKDIGDLTSLADSIKEEGLLQLIGMTEKLELVFDERRLRAHKDILKKKTILARIVDVRSSIAGKYAENEIKIALKRNCDPVTTKFCRYQHVRLNEVGAHDVQHR